MIKLREILNSLYQDRDADSLVSILKKEHLFLPLRKTETQLNELIKNQQQLMQQMKCIPIAVTVSNLLISVNTRIAEIAEKDRKAYEILLSDIVQKLIQELSQQIELKRKEFVLQLAYALEKTCDFQDYDKHQLWSYLNINSIISYTASLKTGDKIINSNGAVPSFVWKGHNQKLESLLDLLIDQSLLLKKRGFIRLFNNPVNEVKLQLNEENADIILQLFSRLKEKKLIGFKDCKSIYDVLRYNSLDFEEKFLKGKTPKERMNVLKNSKAKWASNQALIKNWLEGIGL
jgi:hypothetical protein